MQGRKVLVTGASSGIGASVSQLLASEGAEVIGLSRSINLRSQPYLKQAIQIDLRDLARLEATLKTILEPIDTLVLCAGYGQFGGLEQFSRAQIESLITVNLTANILICKHFLPVFRKRSHADIVLLGSESALRGGKAGAVYCASKFGLRGLAQSLRADGGHGLRVMMVNPGPVDTPFFDKLDFQPLSEDNFSLAPEQVAQAIIHTLKQPPQTVTEEVNLQPLMRSFKKKPSTQTST